MGSTAAPPRDYVVHAGSPTCTNFCLDMPPQPSTWYKLVKPLATSAGGFGLVCILVLLSRYMQPNGLWQRQHAAALRYR